MRKNLLLWPVCAAVSLLFTSCQLLPEEDVLPASPIIYSYEAEEYRMTAVMRGDLVSSTTVNCTYVPAREESLSFSLGGMYIDKVYVNKGDQVRSGQVLAELEHGNLQEQIAAQNYQIKAAELKKIHIAEDQELDLRKYDIILDGLEWELEHSGNSMVPYVQEKKEKRLEERAEVEAAYADQMQAVEDSIYLQKLQIEKLKDDLRKSQIIAGIDGTVTYVSSISEGERSVKGQRIVTISDLDSTVFMVKGDDVQYFPEGTEVVITCRDREFTAYAVNNTEIGAISDEEDKPIAYLRLKQPDPTLKDGTKGNINVVLDERIDVLYIDKKAVRNANGEAFVYMLDEDGMRFRQKITTGFECGNFIEIVSGLKEHDRVIMD